MCLHQVSKRPVISDLDSAIRHIEVQRLVLQTLGKEASDAEKWDRTRIRRMPRISINFQKGHSSIPWGWKKDLDEECWAGGCFTIVKAVFKKPWEAEGLTPSPSYRSESAQLHVPQPLLPELPAPPMSGLMGWLNRFQGECQEWQTPLLCLSCRVLLWWCPWKIFLYSSFTLCWRTAGK